LILKRYFKIFIGSLENMRSSHLKRPTARRMGARKRRAHERVGDVQQEASAEQRVHDFLLGLSTPNLSKPTKKSKWTSRSRMVQKANERAEAVHKAKDRENARPREPAKEMMATSSSLKRGVVHQTQSRTRQRVPNPSASIATAGAVSKAPTSKPPANGSNGKLPKTSIARPNYSRTLSRESRTQPKSASNKKPLSPQTQQQPAIDQYSLSLQIKNSECESLKNEVKALKDRNNALLDFQREHQLFKRQILSLHEESKQKDDRILKLERKLESCGIDSIALRSPAFMNEDTQKKIIFWRERLSKASEKLNDRKLKRKQMVQTAQFHLGQMRR